MFRICIIWVGLPTTLSFLVEISALLVLSSHFLLILAASAAAVAFVCSCVLWYFLAG